MHNSARNVFVNCPFDREYLPLLRPLVFTILDLGFHPRLSLERSDSGEPRIEKIISLIQQSKFGIHDLSRCHARKRGELFRLNMPLELGLDLGCKRFSRGLRRQKKCLILETERYRYQAAVSDLSNSDIFAHGDDPQELIRGVRNWLVQEALAHPKSGSAIWGAFLDFMAENFNRLVREGYAKREIELLPINELKDSMSRWTEKRRRSA